jgi:hypothetical protein
MVARPFSMFPAFGRIGAGPGSRCTEGKQLAITMPGRKALKINTFVDYYNSKSGLNWMIWRMGAGAAGQGHNRQAGQAQVLR